MSAGTSRHQIVPRLRNCWAGEASRMLVTTAVVESIVGTVTRGSLSPQIPLHNVAKREQQSTSRRSHKLSDG